MKAAEGKKDADAIIKWSAQTPQLAKKAVGNPKAEREEVDYAKQVDTYTEYALYLAALQSADPQKVMVLSDSLEKRNPESHAEGRRVRRACLWPKSI